MVREVQGTASIGRILGIKTEPAGSVSKFKVWSQPDTYMHYGGFTFFDKETSNALSAKKTDKAHPSPTKNNKNESYAPKSYDAYTDPKDVNYRTTNKSCFQGKQDFVLRHPSQCVTDFRLEQVRITGSINRPLTTGSIGTKAMQPSNLRSGRFRQPLISNGSLMSSAAYFSVSKNALVYPPEEIQLWKSCKFKQYGGRKCWRLSEYGVQKIIGDHSAKDDKKFRLLSKEDRAFNPSESSYQNHQLSFTSSPYIRTEWRKKAEIGCRIDLADDKNMKKLAKQIPYEKLCPVTLPKLSHYSPPHEESYFNRGKGLIPTIQIVPGEIQLDDLLVEHVYCFPVQINNLGPRLDRFRVKNVDITCGDAKNTRPSVMEVDTRMMSTVLAPGLSAFIDVYIAFPCKGPLSGKIEISTMYGSLTVCILGEVMQEDSDTS